MAGTEYMTFRSRSRDQQDGVERHVWGEQTFVNGAGSVINVRGTDTLDEEVPVLNMGYSFHLPKDYNTEVVLVALGSDTNQKMAILSLPRDKQRQWPEGVGGIQHPTNPDQYIEINDEGFVLRHGKLTLGASGGVTVEVNGEDVLLTGNLKITGDLEVEGAKFNHRGKDVGENHRHSGVETGGGTTGEPI